MMDESHGWHKTRLKLINICVHDTHEESDGH
jgi:hypothetical protein